MKLQVYAISLATIASVSVAINIWQYGLIHELRLRPASLESDRPYIQKAATYWGIKNNTTSAKAMQERYAKVIYFPKLVCVSLDNELGGVGGVPVYCFDQRSGKLLNRFDDVE